MIVYNVDNGKLFWFALKIWTYIRHKQLANVEFNFGNTRMCPNVSVGDMSVRDDVLRTEIEE